MHFRDDQQGLLRVPRAQSRIFLSPSCYQYSLLPWYVILLPATLNLANSFTALLKLDNRQFKFVIDSCMWASKHDNREVEHAGLNMCLELISNIAETDPTTSNAFFQQFFVPILQDVFFVLTDTDHKAGFKSQSMLLAKMFHLIGPSDGGVPKISGPIYTAEQAPAGTSNKEFLGGFVANLLQNAFPNLQPYVLP